MAKNHKSKYHSENLKIIYHGVKNIMNYSFLSNILLSLQNRTLSNVF
jgi:hypothetical protein